MRWASFMGIALWLSACAGDSVDEGMPPVCAGNLYELCATEHGCANQNCRTVANAMICTQACNEATPCPDSFDEPVACNMTTMLCEPSPPTTCRIPQ